MDGWMGGWMDGWIGGWMDGWMGGWMDGWFDGWMGGWMIGWMDGEFHTMLGPQIPFIATRRCFICKTNLVLCYNRVVHLKEVCYYFDDFQPFIQNVYYYSAYKNALNRGRLVSSSLTTICDSKSYYCRLLLYSGLLIIFKQCDLLANAFTTASSRSQTVFMEGQI